MMSQRKVVSCILASALLCLWMVSYADGAPMPSGCQTRFQILDLNTVLADHWYELSNDGPMVLSFRYCASIGLFYKSSALPVLKLPSPRLGQYWADSIFLLGQNNGYYNELEEVPDDILMELMARFGQTIMRARNDLENSKRTVDFGLARGYSGTQEAKHRMGLAAANFPGGPGRRRRSETEV